MQLAARTQELNTISRCKTLLGTFVEITISGNESDDYLIQLTNDAFNEISRIEKIMSYYDNESEVTLLNKFAHKKDCEVSSDLLVVLKKALNLSDLSNGLFDVTIVPSLVKQKLLLKKYHFLDKKSSYKDIIIKGNYISFNRKLAIDLGGIAKGYAVDKAMSLLEEFSDMDIVINAGGDIAMNNSRGKLIDIRYSKFGNLVKLPMYNKSLATSANYYQKEGKSAIINPKTKSVNLSNKTVSVFANDCITADALTKVSFLVENISYILKSMSARAFEIDDKGRIKEIQ